MGLGAEVTQVWQLLISLVSFYGKIICITHQRVRHPSASVIGRIMGRFAWFKDNVNGEKNIQNVMVTRPKVIHKNDFSQSRWMFLCVSEY